MMSVVTLAGVLLAAGTPPATARLELAPDGDDRLALRLCFSSAEAHQLSYRLEVRSSGKAGTSRSSQSGELTSGPTLQCPLNSRLGLNPDTQIQATLEWSLDGQPQPPIQQQYPTAQPAGPTPPEPVPGEPTLPGIGAPAEDGELMARQRDAGTPSNTNGRPGPHAV